ncbi:hypothetical protein IEQ11_01335 [Lysobacter capsici]|uniref:hypothetical protein n=1 Tax=Lysobacter capsici TaxID=435897 RepID=UPI001FF2244E|nr:hypothetical protein [Lysobacter capsici]UOF15339.1 hypothetical protein IEQ11_01335 [Lysobacter capsici]
MAGEWLANGWRMAGEWLANGWRMAGVAIMAAWATARHRIGDFAKCCIAGRAVLGGWRELASKRCVRRDAM